MRRALAMSIKKAGTSGRMMKVAFKRVVGKTLKNAGRLSSGATEPFSDHASTKSFQVALG
jgi:hypothetical protein